jgi:hypothetical protein
MPIYFFSVQSPNGDAPDGEGIDLPDLEAAKAEAARSIRELIAERMWANKGAGLQDQMHVTDKAGKLVYALAFNTVLAP